MTVTATLATTSNCIGAIPWMWLWVSHFGTEHQLTANTGCNWSQSSSTSGGRLLIRSAGSGGGSLSVSKDAGIWYFKVRNPMETITHPGIKHGSI